MRAVFLHGQKKGAAKLCLSELRPGKVKEPQDRGSMVLPDGSSVSSCLGVEVLGTVTTLAQKGIIIPPIS